MLTAQVRKVDPKKTITFEVPGATAAYGLDEFIAEATADNGQVAVTGNQPGATRVVVVTPAGTQTFEIRVTQPPPNYPPGFEMPVSAEEKAQPELIAGGGYIYPLTANWSLTGSFYRIQVPGSDRIGRTGNVGDLRYRYSPWEDFWFTADLGISHGIGGAGRLHYVTRRDSLLGLVRYMPPAFAALGTNNMRGFHADIAWTRHVTRRFQTSVSFYNNNLVLPSFKERRYPPRPTSAISSPGIGPSTGEHSPRVSRLYNR